jgi:hypothetical protein
MADIIVPDYLTLACDLCDKVFDKKDPTRPWEKHDPKVMPVVGLKLNRGEIFGYIPEEPLNNLFSGVLICGLPQISRVNHRLLYTAAEFHILKEGETFMYLDGIIRNPSPNMDRDSLFLNEKEPYGRLFELTEDQYDLALMTFKARTRQEGFIGEQHPTRGILKK